MRTNFNVMNGSTKIMSAVSLMIVMSLTLATNEAKADDDSGWFIAAGASFLDANFKNVDDVDFDESDDTFNLKAGYMFSDVFGLEAGWIDLGTYEQGGRGSLDADAFTIAAIANWSVANNWDLYAKGGLAVLDARSDQFIPGFGRVDESDTTEEPFIGVGVEYDFGAWNLYGEYSIVDTEVRDLTIDILSFGIKYEFGR